MNDSQVRLFKQAIGAKSQANELYRQSTSKYHLVIRYPDSAYNAQMIKQAEELSKEAAKLSAEGTRLYLEATK